MKIIKLSEEQYIVVDDSEIKIGDIVAEKLLTGKYDLFTIHTLNDVDKSTQKKIVYSTQPESLCMGSMQSVLPLFLSEVKELLGEVDVEKKAKERYTEKDFAPGEILIRKIAWINGYNECLEDNKEKKYTETDIKNAIIRAYSIMGNRIDVGYFNEVIQSLQPETEWEVEFVDGKLKLKP